MNIPFIYRLIFISFLFFACQPEKEEDKSDFEGTLKYFAEESVYPRDVYIDENDTTTLLLPNCFESSYYSSSSLTHKNIYYCNTYAVYFFVDAIQAEQLNNYFPGLDLTDKKNATLNQIQEDLINRRENSLRNVKRSVPSILYTKNNKEMLLCSVIGENPYSSYASETLFYQFGFIEENGVYYILQFIAEKENASFLMEDLWTVFRNFEGH